MILKKKKKKKGHLRFADLICLRIVDKRRVESVQEVQICLMFNPDL